jgi:hypothetical protein
MRAWGSDEVELTDEVCFNEVRDANGPDGEGRHLHERRVRGGGDVLSEEGEETAC